MPSENWMIWEEKFSVGIKQFDEEHRQLISYLNKLHLGLVSGDNVGAMVKVLDGLVTYTQSHFAHEESLMSAHSYPQYEAHKKEHEDLIAKVVDFESRLTAGKASFSLELMSFLKDWLVIHIQGTDKKYSDFFKEKGVA